MGVCKAGFDCIMYNFISGNLFFVLGIIMYANEVETKEK